MRAERYILQTKAGQEQQVRKRLGLRDIAAIAPRTRRFERQRGGHLVLCTGPAMPGYVFPRVAASQLPMLREVEGACPRPLMADGRVRPMSRVERSRVAEILRDPPSDPRDPYPDGKPDHTKPPFRVGQSVTVTKGPFFSFRAVVERVWVAGKRWQVKVEVTIFGRPTPVDIDAGSLAAA